MRLARRAFLAIAASTTFASLAPAAELSKEPLSKVKENVEAEKAILVDVREKKEWHAGHIEGAIFLPLSAVQDGLTKDELKKLPKDKVLYVHCVVGKRAVTAGNVFEKHGFKVRPIKPGYKEMVAAGFPKAKAERSGAGNLRLGGDGQACPDNRLSRGPVDMGIVLPVLHGP